MASRDRDLVCRVVRDFRITRQAPLGAMASVLQVHHSTVSRWCGASSPPPRIGRPRRPVDLWLCCRVLAKINQMAGRITVKALRKLFPEAARAWLADTLTRTNKHRAWRRRRHLAKLEWTTTGSVWAMDFTALNGRDDEHALCVRDVASGSTLYAAVVTSECADEVCAVLERLFAEHGAPLVLKSDNGPAFVHQDLKDLIARHDVLGLYSPPRTPRYNGACEAGIGGLKRVASDLQLDDPLPAQLGDYLQRAADILLAQPVSRRRGAPTRAEAWRARPECTPALREALFERYQVHALAQSAKLGIAPDQRLTHAEQASLDRYAIREALCDLQLLVIRRA
jgi:transposase InsO family protein